MRLEDLGSGVGGMLVSASLGFVSALLGLALARIHPILLPAVRTAAIYPVYLGDLRAGRIWSAVVHVLLWAAASGAAVTAATVASGGGVGPLILMGESYRAEMFEWIRTGRGAEGDPSLFFWPKVREIAVFSALSLASGGMLGLALGAVLLNYMNFYYGCLILSAVPGREAVVLAAGWPIYAILRVVGYTALGTVLSVPLLRLLGQTDLGWRDLRRPLTAAAVLIALDFLLKAAFANLLYRPVLRGAVSLP